MFFWLFPVDLYPPVRYGGLSAGVFKAKSGKNSKMMFVFNSPRAFDTIKLSNQVYEILKESGYKQRSIEQGIQATINLFAVPATRYFEAFPDKKPQMWSSAKLIIMLNTYKHWCWFIDNMQKDERTICRFSPPLQ